MSGFKDSWEDGKQRKCISEVLAFLSSMRRAVSYYDVVGFRSWLNDLQAVGSGCGCSMQSRVNIWVSLPGFLSLLAPPVPAPFPRNTSAIPSGSLPSIFCSSLALSYSFHPPLPPQPMFPRGSDGRQPWWLPGPCKKWDCQPRSGLALQASSSSLVQCGLHQVMA